MLYLVHLQFFWSSYFYSLFYDRLPSTLTIKKTLPLVLFNQLTTCLIIYNLESSFSNPYITFKDFFIRWIPISTVKYLVGILLLNLQFGTMHYLVHKYRYIYDKIHYIHHRQIIPLGFGAIYAHPLEHLFVNLLPIITSIFLLDMDILLSTFFVANLSWMTVQSHTVYKTKISKSRHGIHHLYNYYNFDNYPYIVDRFLKTFKNSK